MKDSDVRATLRNRVRSLTQPLRDVYMSWPLWFHVLNAFARRAFLTHPVAYTAEQTRIIKDLEQNGIAFTSLEALFPDVRLADLQAYAASLAPIAKPEGSKKDFILEYWEEEPTLSFSNPFVRLALDERALAVVNGYMRMWSKFYYFMLGRAVPQGAGAAPRASQRWHRDYEEIKMCKMFVYLNDVDESAGPFIYIPKSQHGGAWRNIFPQRPGIGSYPPDGAVEQIVPASEMKVCTGKAGTVLFADTTGLHRGGFATTSERLMFTAGYNSSAAFGRRRYRLPKDAAEYAALPDVSRFALRGLPPN